jgi:hypothetical protein
LRNQSKPVEEEKAITSDEDAPDDAMFGADTLFSRMFAPKAHPKPNVTPPARQSLSALLPPIKTEPIESVEGNVLHGNAPGDSVDSHRDSRDRRRDADSIGPPAPSYFPFMLGEMLQTEAPVAANPQDRYSTPSLSTPQRSSSLILEYDNSGSDDVSSILRRSSLTSSRADAFPISRASSGLLGDADSVSEPVHLEPGSQSQQYHSDGTYFVGRPPTFSAPVDWLKWLISPKNRTDLGPLEPP